MKKIYILVLFFTSFSQLSYSQFSTSTDYFPLQIGNRWVYERFQLPGAVTSYLQISITKDTTVNNRRYCFIHHLPEQADYWVRYDTTDGILYYFYETESPYVKLAANVGDTTNFICSAVIDTSFYNLPTTLKKFYKHSSAPHSSSGTEMELAKHFGQTYYFEYSASFTTSNYLYAWLKGCIINGVLYGDMTFPIGITEITSEIPLAYMLSQNFPNPFNPQTQISFDIPNSAFVSLTVYDELGREIEKLVNEELSPGSYKYDWNALQYPSGIYFYRIQAGNPSTGSGGGFVQTKKMILIK